MKRLTLSAGCAAVAIAAIACAGERADPRFATPPIETPSRFLAVSGTIAPQLSVELLVEYQTSKDACQVTIDRSRGFTPTGSSGPLWVGAPVVGGTVAVVDEMPEAFARVVLQFFRG